MNFYWKIHSGESSQAFAMDCIFHYIGQSRNIDICMDKNEYGKPYIRSMTIDGMYYNKKIFFNLSHSGELIICAVAGHEVGADCQEIVRAAVNIHSISERFFTKEENDYLSKQVNDYTNAFFEIWTRKEAFIKYTGKGLSEGLKSFSVIQNGSLAETVANARICSIVMDAMTSYKCVVCFSDLKVGEDINIIRLR